MCRSCAGWRPSWTRTASSPMTSRISTCSIGNSCAEMRKAPNNGAGAHFKEWEGGLSIEDVGDVAAEQPYVSMLYERLDRLRKRASGHLAETLAGGVATPDQGMSQRDSTAAEWSRRIGQLNAAENGLCFGPLDLEDGERRYVGRLGIVDHEGDYDSLLLDWRAP